MIIPIAENGKVYQWWKNFLFVDRDQSSFLDPHAIDCRLKAARCRLIELTGEDYVSLEFATKQDYVEFMLKWS